MACTCNRCNFAKATSLAASENRTLCYDELNLILTAAIRILFDIAARKSLRQTREFLREKLAGLGALTDASETAPDPAEA